jgi:hypothetical protein
MRKRISRIALVSAAAIAMIVPVAGPASADPIELCYVWVVVDTPPSASAGPGGAKVETGEYHVEQNCVVINKDAGTSL